MESGFEHFLLHPASSSPLLFFDGHLFLFPSPSFSLKKRTELRAFPASTLLPFAVTVVAISSVVVCLFVVVGHVFADISSVVVDLFSVVSTVIDGLVAVLLNLLGLLIFLLLKISWGCCCC